MTSTDLATRAPRAVETLDDRIAKAKLMAEASILPPSYRKNPANILVAMEAADALGISLMQAVNGVHVIDGRMALSAELMRALILRDGHLFKIEALTVNGCRILAARRDDLDNVQTFDYTAEDAKRAGLTTGNHAKHPKAMLLARASTLVARALFADVVAGMAYEPDEIEAAPPVRAVDTSRLMPKPAAPALEATEVPGVMVDSDGVVYDEADIVAESEDAPLPY